MSKATRPADDDLRPEYDFASMKGGVRGKYVARLRKGSNLVLLEPEVAAAFPSAEAVNEALRGVLNTTRAVRGKGGLPNKALQPTLLEDQTVRIIVQASRHYFGGILSRSAVAGFDKRPNGEVADIPEGEFE